MTYCEIPYMTLSIPLGQVSYKNFKEMDLTAIQKWKSTPHSERYYILINKMGKNKKLLVLYIFLLKFDKDW